MIFEYKIKNIVLNMDDMRAINKYYEAACTAEYLVKKYNISEEKAIELGYDIRRLMNKYDYDEEDAINEILYNEEEDEDE